MRPGIGRNASYALGDYLTSRPKGHSQPRELWFSIYSCICMPCAGLRTWNGTDLTSMGMRLRLALRLVCSAPVSVEDWEGGGREG